MEYSISITEHTNNEKQLLWERDSRVFLLAIVKNGLNKEPMYQLINLKNGNRWDSPKQYEEAVQAHKPFTGKVTLTQK